MHSPPRCSISDYAAGVAVFCADQYSTSPIYTSFASPVSVTRWSV